MNATFNGFSLTGTECEEKVLHWEETFDQLIDTDPIVLRSTRLQTDRKNVIYHGVLTIQRQHASQSAAVLFVAVFNNALLGVGALSLTVDASTALLEMHMSAGGPVEKAYDGGPSLLAAQSGLPALVRQLSNATCIPTSSSFGVMTSHSVRYSGS